MKFGINLFSVNQRYWPDVAEEADRLGFESLWIPEHVVVPMTAAGSPYHGAEHPPIPSHLPIVDSLAMLCHLAARTERIRLGTHVYNIGLRHPFLTARSATTVDILSGGRLDLGIGASWLRSEWEAMGLDFDSRGARVDEAIGICRRLWSEDVVEHHGEFFDFGPTAFEPKPVQKPLALHIGGDGSAALRRAATVGTGWAPMNHSLTQLPQAIARLRTMAEAVGRTDTPQITIPGEIKTVEDVAVYAAAGATRVIVQPWPNSRQAIEGLRHFAREILDRTGSRIDR